MLALEEFDDWVQGLGVVGTRLFILAGGGNTILEFAYDSGQRIGEFPLEGIPYAQGLACR